MNHWLRLWHDMPNDPKWRTIARVSGRSISEVVSVYIHILVCSSNATERGRTHPNADLFAEDTATALDLETSSVQSIIAAMQGRVLDGERISGWDKRQPQREDNAADRAKQWRETKKAERKRTQTNANEPKIREEEIREEKNKNNISPSADVWFVKEFWPLWPVKDGKEAARVAAKKLIAEDRGSAITGVLAQAAKIRAMERPIHASTWLNGRRWEDETIMAVVPRQSGSLFPPRESSSDRITRVMEERIRRDGKL